MRTTILIAGLLVATLAEAQSATYPNRRRR
jgi:hypothetical protein